MTYPAIWVQHFAVSGPAEASGLRKGIADMLINDLVQPIKEKCDGVVVEREHLDLIIAEQKLSRSPLVDPATRIRPGRLIGHNRVVSGTLTISGATATLTVTVTNTTTGVTRSVTHTGTVAGEGVFDLEKSVVDDVAKLICDPPARYAGPVSGSIPAFAGGVSGTFSWSGTVSLVLDHLGPAPSGSPPGQYAFFRPDGGTVHLALDMVDGHCTGHGETDIGVDPEQRPQLGAAGRAAADVHPLRRVRRLARHRLRVDRRDARRPVRQRRHAALRRRPTGTGHPDAPVAVDHTGREHHRQLPRAHGQCSPSVVARAAGLTRVDTVSTARAPW